LKQINRNFTIKQAILALEHSNEPTAEQQRSKFSKLNCSNNSAFKQQAHHFCWCLYQNWAGIARETYQDFQS